MLPKKIKKVIIESVKPIIDGGLYPVKREIGDSINITADIFKDGHDILVAKINYKHKNSKKWHEAPMTHINNDKWSGSFSLTKIGKYEYTIEAYVNQFETWLHDIKKKAKADIFDPSDLLEGLIIVNKSIELSDEPDAKSLEKHYKEIHQYLEEDKLKKCVKAFQSNKLNELMLKNPDKSICSTYDKTLTIQVDRIKARYASWYEFFPRSQGQIEGQSGTFKDCENRLDEINKMGFDVIYLPPIHPIGVTNRKGPNNSLIAKPEDPGCPYAIGNTHGGHKAIDPGLGTFEDFENFVKKAHSFGMDIALDFAINCSPDHPYVKEHPEWFFQRPDGSIKYAENPPKKYEDIYPLNFYCENMENLWEEMLSIILFWIDKGVTIFRVDNPHTKPIDFWKWLIQQVQEQHPEIIFLAEAFTRPKVMKSLAKVGFSQSYTYFTWRNFKEEIIDYFTELTTPPVNEYFRGNLFTNTPDILPKMLQDGGKPAFELRAVLASTLSSVYGIYSGYELCENDSIPGKEEYNNSEKYQYVLWNWDRPGNIKPLISKLNKIRKENEALQHYNNLKFYHADNHNILVYGKTTEDLSNVIIIIVNLDPFQKHHSFIHIPTEELGIKANENYLLEDLLNNEYYIWKGSKNFVNLDPKTKTAHIFRLKKWQYTENDFDYYN